MTDATLRHLERAERNSARHLAARLRAGTLRRFACQSPGESYRNPFSHGPAIHYSRYHTILDCDLCPDCNGSGLAPSDEALRLAAYAGCEAAREAVGSDTTWRVLDSGSYGIDSVQLDVWVGYLTRWPGAPLLAALAAGRTALRAQENRNGDMDLLEGDLVPSLTPARQALTAAQAHADNPTEETWEACHQACGSVASKMTWAWAPARIAAGSDDPLRDSMRRGTILRDACASAASLTDEATVRSTICEKLIEWALI